MTEQTKSYNTKSGGWDPSHVFIAYMDGELGGKPQFTVIEWEKYVVDEESGRVSYRPTNKQVYRGPSLDDGFSRMRPKCNTRRIWNCRDESLPIVEIWFNGPGLIK
ncbi:MAG: hypothetical protein HC888_03225 [Candidatus Competibacteraceae bacterium]|nr:hypothetical protein [Candidatus Competibacteraceae bacterium]